MAGFRFFLAVCAVAFLVPFQPAGRIVAPVAEQTAFPGWPQQWEGRELRELPLSEREQRFLQDFPGRVGRFTDGQREIIIRWVAAPTRKLHPAADCFAAIGYAVTPLPLRVDAAGRRWSASRVTRRDETLKVYELIADTQNAHWPDVSAWYWAALAENTNGPWWAYTIAER
jgi:hypothetical protein